MSLPRLLSLPAALALTAVALLTAGCAAGPGAPAPTSSADPSSSASASADGVVSAFSDIEAVWLDSGRGLAVVTWGSSSCAPEVADVSGGEQRIDITLAGSAEKACTDDLAPRALYLDVPDGVDVSKDVELRVAHGARTDHLDLDALAEAPPARDGQPQASAGWFEDDGIVLLTWGSSSCAPVVEAVEPDPDGARATFQDADGVCTMDFAPRATPIILPDEVERDRRPFTLTLTGGGLDGKVGVE